MHSKFCLLTRLGNFLQSFTSFYTIPLIWSNLNIGVLTPNGSYNYWVREPSDNLFEQT